MREAPQWFQDELKRTGGVNPYGEPIFKLVWSPEERMVIGGRWAKDGFEGYKTVPAISGDACWALMMWEPRELQGSPERWEYDYRDPETGYLQCGGYPKYGRYRLLKRFIHREIVQAPIYRQMFDGKKPYLEQSVGMKAITYRMEPCGLILDLMLPALRIWLKMSDAAKTKALLQEEQAEKDKFLASAKDARSGTRLSRASRGSQLVQKRAELIERGMEQAMRIAAQTGLGMRIAA